MKISEAKQIVGTIIEWQLVLKSIKERSEIKSTIDLKKYSLIELIKANDLVSQNNKVKRKRQQKTSDSGKKTMGVSISMTLDDKLIAGCYVALHFSPNGEMHVLFDDVAVACIRPNYA